MLFHDHELVPLGVSGLISVTIGGLAMLATRKAPKVLNARDGFLIVAIGWILFSFFGKNVIKKQ